MRISIWLPTTLSGPQDPHVLTSTPSPFILPLLASTPIFNPIYKAVFSGGKVGSAVLTCGHKFDIVNNIMSPQVTKDMIARYYSSPLMVAVQKEWGRELAAMTPDERIFWEKTYDLTRHIMIYGRLPTPEERK